MRQLALLCVLVIQFSSAQTVKRRFVYADAKLVEVLADIEQRFDIKYSYADSVAVPKTFSLDDGQYTLEQVNAEVERQTKLSIVKINARYYSIYQKDAILHEELEEITIVGFLSKGITKSKSEFTVSPQKVDELPGVTDADILFSLQQLPGVKSPNETASGLHVRGGTPDQNLILWDGIRMYHPGHLFGMISGFNPNVDQTVHYINKGTDPKYGERISSIISIETSDKIQDSMAVNAGINALNADCYAKIPISSKIGVQVSGRKSFTEWLQTPTFDALSDKVFQHTDFGDFDDDNRFDFQDASVKTSWKPNGANTFSITGIWIDNHLDFSSKQLDDSTIGQNMDIRNLGGSVHWNSSYSFGLEQNLLLHYSSYTFDYNNERIFSDSDFSRFSKTNRVVDSGIELNFRYQVSTKSEIDFGYQLSGNDISHAFNRITPDLNIELDQKHLKNVAHAGFGNWRIDIGSWHFLSGFRYNVFSQLDEKSFEPRAFVQKVLTDRFSLQVSFEQKSQILSQIRESVANDQSLENYVWVLSDGREYPIQKARQYTAGFTFKSKSILIDGDFYRKTIDGITSLAFGFLHQYDSEIRKGTGFNNGFDLLVQKSGPTWRIWATYTFQDSQNKYDGLNGDAYFPISSDTRHSFSISAHKRWSRISASAGWFWRTGKPYSLLNGENSISSFNGERLPVYHRMDASAAYEFHKSSRYNAKIGVSILNLYDRHSVISKEYERQYITIGDLIRSNYVVRDYYSLGFTPNVFVRVVF